MTDKKAIFKEVDLPPDPTRGLASKHEKCANNNFKLLKVGHQVKFLFSYCPPSLRGVVDAAL
jgi:hypothetical protein